MEKALGTLNQHALKILTTIILGLTIWTLKTVVDLKVLVSENQLNNKNQLEKIKDNENRINRLYNFHYALNSDLK